jgi:uncharacterized protein with HEPN domain
VIRSDEQRVADILEFADKLERYVLKGFEEFCSEFGTGLAIERLLELIGEASSRLSDEYKESMPEVPWREIAGMRTLLAHAYHRIDFAIVWTTATNSVPELARYIRAK